MRELRRATIQNYWRENKTAMIYIGTVTKIGGYEMVVKNLAGKQEIVKIVGNFAKKRRDIVANIGRYIIAYKRVNGVNYTVSPDVENFTLSEFICCQRRLYLLNTLSITCWIFVVSREY